MTVTQLSATFVTVVLLHNAEEARFLPRWSMTASRWYRPVGAWQFRFAVSIFSGLVAVVAMLAVHDGPQTASAYLFFGVVFAMAANAIIPHLVLTVAMRRYMPGTATGVLFNLPLGTYMLGQALDEQWISARTMLWVAPLVAVVLVGTIPVLLAMGRRLAPVPGSRSRGEDL